MIIACCMLDSLPMLRIRGQSHVTAGPTGNGTASAASEDVAPNTVDNTDKIHGGKAGYVQRMKGGNVSHIGKCTDITPSFDFTPLTPDVVASLRALHCGLLELPAVPGEHTAGPVAQTSSCSCPSSRDH